MAESRTVPSKASPQILGVSAVHSTAHDTFGTTSKPGEPVVRQLGNRRTLVLLYFVGFIEGSDMQLLPATFTALEFDLGLSPALLGQMSLAQSLFMALSSPVWGWLADRYSRKTLLVFSCIAWGFVTTLLACATTIWAMVALRCLHGAALSSLGPIAQSVVADITEAHQRGVAFGCMYSAVAMGQILASLVGTSAAGLTVAGIRGWRMVFAFIAAISLLAASIIKHGMEEPPRDASPSVMNEETSNKSKCKTGLLLCSLELERLRALMKIPTFSVIAIQGIFGCVPWNALGFLAMYLHYCGRSDASAASIASCLLLGRAVGGVVGGFIGDSLARWSPNHGRAFTAQASVMLGIPFIMLLVRAGPSASSAVLCLLSFGLGGVASWCSAGVNRPILAEVVSPSGRASVVAWISAIEGSSGALFGAPVVGFLAEKVYGYRKSANADIAAETYHGNARALSQAILWGTMPAWIVCAVFYSLLHRTYGVDARNARHAYVRVDDAEEVQMAPLKKRQAASPDLTDGKQAGH